MPTLFIVSSITTSRTQQSSPLTRSAVKWRWEWLIGCGGDSMCRFSMPTCETRVGGRIFSTVVPGGFRYLASNESESGTSSVILLPSMAAIRRSVVVVRPARIQVCGRPLRTRSCICMNSTQARVTGRWMTIVSPTAKPAASATVKESAPEGTYSSAMVVRASTNPSVGTLGAVRSSGAGSLRRRRRSSPGGRTLIAPWGRPTSLSVDFDSPSAPLPRRTTPLVEMRMVPSQG